MAYLTGDVPNAQPVEPSMPLRPRLAPGTPVQAMTVPSDPTGAGKHPFVVILSKQQATDIYMMRSPETTTDEFKDVAGKSSMVAEMYRVSPKTIRDIWNRKTWTQVTRTSWTAEEAEEYAQEQALAKLPPSERAALKDDFKKRRGRPPGSKDTRPRRRRLKVGEKGEATEGVMYVTTEEGAVEVRPIPAAPSTSDSFSRSESPVRQAPPFNPQRAQGLRALREFESGKALAEAKRSQSFDFAPPSEHSSTFDFGAAPAAPSSGTRTIGRSQSFDMMSTPPFAFNAFIPSAMPTAVPGAVATWAEEEPAPCRESCESSSSPGASEESTQNEEDPDFQQQNILGPVDDQLDIINISSTLAARPPPTANRWTSSRPETSSTGMTLEQEFEHRRQSHQANFAESRSMLDWIVQHHSNPFASSGFNRVSSAPSVYGKAASPIVSSMSSAPAVAPLSAEEEELQPQGCGASEIEEAVSHAHHDGHHSEGAMGSMSVAPQPEGVPHGCESNSGMWFPGSAGGNHGSSAGGEGADWHSLLMSRETSRDVSCIDKQLSFPSAAASPCIAAVLSRSGMSGLQSVSEGLQSVSEEGWWGFPSGETESWRA
eukprot:CAMPEP_0174927966 /NCGR_PEP_ID=MMETSP1355-20121228/22666_1 /TAXON_ID=464990 /ORGANISM="Hemiselmis tepida, Strain CCMP443" /LENGTH=598 /DNA_ID=CAMNT_0016174105 /DNA_START=290 /DNA_END=2082 /DNA_ORIENTATION=-